MILLGVLVGVTLLTLPVFAVRGVGYRGVYVAIMIVAFAAGVILMDLPARAMDYLAHYVGILAFVASFAALVSIALFRPSR